MERDATRPALRFTKKIVPAMVFLGLGSKSGAVVIAAKI
jgi:hypothetical protein